MDITISSLPARDFSFVGAGRRFANASSALVHGLRGLLSAATLVLAVAMALGLALDGAPATAGLVAYYPLDGNLNDASGNGNNGTAGTNLTFGASGSGRTGSAGDQGIVSSGSDFNQYFTSPVDINGFNQVTFGGWFKTVATNPVRGLITNDSGGFGRGIDIDNRGVSGYAAFNGSGPIGGGTITGGFDFVAVAYDRTANAGAGGVTLDVNGTFYTATGLPPNSIDAFLTIGKNFHFDAPFGGTIDDVFIFNQALTQAQLNSLQATPAPEPASCVLLGLGALGLFAAARRRRKA